MSTAVAVYHGRFGRATLYQLDRPMTTHAHREGHVIFQVQGEAARVGVSGREYALTPGAAVVINPWEPHAFVPGAARGGGLFLILYIDPSWFLGIRSDGQPALRFGATGIDVTDPIGASVETVTGHLLDCRPIDGLDGMLYQLVSDCFARSWHGRAPASGRAPFAGAAEPASDFRVRRSQQLLSDRLGASIRLDAVAREAGLSRPQFYKLFRRQTGVTPNLYLNILLVERALEALTRTAISVTELGFDLGFSSQSGFTRFFAANVGMAPSDYRRVAQVLSH